MVQRFVDPKEKLLGYLIILIIALLFIGGFWYNYQFKKLDNSSIIYQKILNNSPISLITAEDFIKNNNNIYGTLISLNIAKEYVDKQDFYKAELQLKQGLKTISDVNLQSILKLRLARIQLQQKKINEALYILKSIKGITWRDIVADLEGDAWLSKGNFYKAYESWYNGIAVTTSPIMKQIMKFKMNNLPESVQKSFNS
ncbi:MAG: tetratricopeptide repeat protein [Candidatus Dasytiphilus stammeri]